MCIGPATAMSAFPLVAPPSGPEPEPEPEPEPVVGFPFVGPLEFEWLSEPPQPIRKPQRPRQSVISRMGVVPPLAGVVRGATAGPSAAEGSLCRQSVARGEVGRFRSRSSGDAESREHADDAE